MIDRRQRRRDSFDRLDRGRLSPRDHQHLDAEQAGCLDLRIGGGAAAVLGNDDIDMVLPQQSQFAFQRERTAIEDIIDIRKRQRRLDGVDAADEIVMLRCRFRIMRTLPAGCHEDAARGGAKRSDRRRNASQVPPMIARQALPFGTAQSDCGYADGLGSMGGIGGNALGEGMRGVDQQIISAGLQEIGERRSPAETTDSNRNRLRGRFFGTTGQRQKNVAIVTRRERFGQQTRLVGAAEDQDARSSHG